MLRERRVSQRDGGAMDEAPRAVSARQMARDNLPECRYILDSPLPIRKDHFRFPPIVRTVIDYRVDIRVSGC